MGRAWRKRAFEFANLMVEIVLCRNFQNQLLGCQHPPLHYYLLFWNVHFLGASIKPLLSRLLSQSQSQVSEHDIDTSLDLHHSNAELHLPLTIWQLKSPQHGPKIL